MDSQQMYRQPSKENVQEQLRQIKNQNQQQTTSTGASQKNLSIKEKSLSQAQEGFENVPDTPGMQNSQILSNKQLNEQSNQIFHHTSQNSSVINQVNVGENTYQGNINQSSSANRHLSNKSESNLNQNSIYNVKNADGKNKKDEAENPKRRKLSEKQKQRRTSNNRTKGDGHSKDIQIPPIDGANLIVDKNNISSGPNRSMSKGNSKAANISQSITGTTSADNTSIIKGHPPQFLNGQQFFDQQNYNPFSNGLGQNGFAQIPQMAQTHGFPFGAGAGGPFMPQGQPAPQVHFIARKQQFIAQISPEQLASGDKRPYTAQSLNNFSASGKRTGSVYANAINNAAKNAAAAGGFENPTNTAAMLFIEGGNYLPYSFGLKNNQKRINLNNAAQKQAANIYGEDKVGKFGPKDLQKTLGSSNGFSSGYASDPYNSVMSSGLPATLGTHSTKPTKAKAQNRLQGKEKEQLYDETIKMKMLNNQMREEHVKLKTKIKILENELGRKEKTIEDLFNHNQIIQQASSKHQTSSNQSLLPLAQTAQKYQQETFLVMSLKKQIRELKLDVVKRDEELEILRKNIKNTRTQEFEQELQTYHDECLRLRSVLEEVMKQGQSHPIHQQVVAERMQELEQQLVQKEMMIQKMQENRMSSANIYLNDEKINSLPGVRSTESQNIDTHQSEMNQNNNPVSGSASAQTQNGRDKSADRKQNINLNQQQRKEIEKELLRARKALRDKDKELLKAKADMIQIKKEQAEKAKTNASSKDVESQVKQLKDRILVQKGEARRREERLTEADTKLKRLEEAMQGIQENLKQSEESNKQLKAQLRSAKHKQKNAVEASVQAIQTQPDQVNSSGSKKSLSPLKQREKLQEKDDKGEKSEKLQSDVPREELSLMTLIGQREKLCRDDLTAMMLAGEDSLRMLIKEPSENLINFVKMNLQDEDTLLAGIPRYEIPRSDFERQVLREMRIVLKDNNSKITEKTKEELMKWNEFVEFYGSLENFDYPHKDKLLEFIKYFFLDHIVNSDTIMINYQAFKDHLNARRPAGATPEKSRNPSHLRSGARSQDSSKSRECIQSGERKREKILGGSEMGEEEKGQEEEKMLDIAEQCFMRIADLLHIAQRTVRQVFLRYSQPELFKDGSVLELLSPRGFLEGIKDVGFEDVTELEAACLMKVLAKPELDNSVILNEFVLIMENFGVPVLAEEDEYENDYIPDSDIEQQKQEEKKEENKEENKDDSKEAQTQAEKPEEHHMKFAEKRKSIQKNSIALKFDILDEKGHKILKKLARFLLERYMHPREFFGPTIKKEIIGKKKCKVEVIKLHDFYLRIKLASIRKKIKENVTVNQFMAIDGEKYPGFVQVKRMIKALEVVAEKEQELMIKEQEEKQKEHKEKIKKLADERAAQGLPSLTDEELEKLINPPKEGQKDTPGGDKKVKDYLENEKKPSGKSGLEEVVKLGGKPPKLGERDGKSRFASIHGPGGQLNTIEEDLHETQTSHYSYQVKEGDKSDREGSYHQLSTHLRNSAALNEMEDSGHRSGGGGRGLPVGHSVHSADYSEKGSISSSKKKGKDIESSDIQISEFRDFKKKKGTDPKIMSHDMPDSLGFAQKQIDDPISAPSRTPNGVTSCMSVRNNIPHSMQNSKSNKLEEENEGDDNEYEMDNDEHEKMKDELDKEVNKKIEAMQGESGLGVMQEDSPSKETYKKPGIVESEEENYSDDDIEDQPEESNQRPSKLSQDESVPEEGLQDQIPKEQLTSQEGMQTKKEGLSEGEDDYEF